MKIEHVAVWTTNLEDLRQYYIEFFDAVSNNKYVNTETGFESYILSFASGARLELMKKPTIPQNLNDTIVAQHCGIIHIAFGVDSMAEVDEKSKQLQSSGYTILRGPRKTGDGYYEFETLDTDKNRIEVTTRYVE